MKTLTLPELFGDPARPLRVVKVQLDGQSRVVITEAVKIIFVLAGEAELRRGREVSRLSEGVVVMVPGCKPCHTVPTTSVRLVNLYIHPSYLREQLSWLPLTYPLAHQLRRAFDASASIQLLCASPEAIRKLTPTLVGLARTPADNEVLEHTAHVAMLFDAVARAANSGRQQNRSQASTIIAPRREVTAAVSLMRGRLSHPWTVDEVARHVALSTSQLTRLFRDQLDVSPAAYLVQLRIDQMAELLATTHISVTQAARAVGWANIRSAARAFKRRYEVSPREFATRARLSPIENRYGGDRTDASSLPKSRLTP